MWQSSAAVVLFTTAYSRLLGFHTCAPGCCCTTAYPRTHSPHSTHLHVHPRAAPRPPRAQEQIFDPSAVAGVVGSAYTPGGGGLGTSGLGQGLNGQGWVGQGPGLGGGLAGSGLGGAAGLGSSGLGLSADPGKGNVGSGGLLSSGAKAVLALLKGLGVPPALALFVVRSLARNSNGGCVAIEAAGGVPACVWVYRIAR